MSADTKLPPTPAERIAAAMAAGDGRESEALGFEFMAGMIFDKAFMRHD